MVAELVDTPMYEFTDHRRLRLVRPHHRRRRPASRATIPGGSCRRPRTVVSAAVRPAPGSVVVPATRRVGGRPGGTGLVQERRRARRLRRAVAVGVLAVVIAVVIACSWITIRTALGRIGGGPLATAGAPGGGRVAAVRVWIVRPGDTLWTIAEAVDPNGDVRPLVDRLAGEAGGTAIYPGESIAIPGR